LKILLVSIISFLLGIALFAIEPYFHDYEIHVYFIALGLTAGGLMGIGVFLVFRQFVPQRN